MAARTANLALQEMGALMIDRDNLGPLMKLVGQGRIEVVNSSWAYNFWLDIEALT